MSEMEGYKFLEPEQIPCLALAVVQNPAYPRRFNFKPDRKWLPVIHQVGGYACNHVYLDATILVPKDYAKINALAKHYDDSCLGQYYLTLSQANDYAECLKTLLGVDCDNTYDHLQEGIYPIDAKRQNIGKLACDILPEDLDNLIDWEWDSQKFGGIIGRWHLFILGENCD